MRTRPTSRSSRFPTGSPRLGIPGRRLPAWVGVLAAAVACSRASRSPPAPADFATPSPPAAPDASSPPAAAAAPDSAGIALTASDVSASLEVLAGGETARPVAESEVPAPPRPPGSMADLDPTNDLVTGPPDPLPDCEARLDAAGIRRASADLPVRRLRNGDVCGVEQALTYREGPTGIRWSPHPVASCGLALALARFEVIAQEEAERFLGSRITRIEQGGTTACRRIARFPGMMSEHSYANGIDVRSFKLANGRTVTVLRHFGATDEVPTSPEGRFLRSLAHRIYDEDVFSVVLTAFWDHRHDDHFHLDLARYRVDGTR